MKRYWIFILVSLLVLGMTTAGLAAVTQIKDVEPSHWAYKSVKMLIEKGYLSLYEDSTFRGDKTVTRYQLAEVVAKILEKIDNGTLTVATGDANDIRKLVVELNNELVKIAYQQNLFTSRVSEVEKNQIAVNEGVASSREEILQMIDQLEALKQLTSQLAKANEEEAKAIKAQMTVIEKKMADGLAFSITGIAELGDQLENVKTEMNAKQDADTAALKSLKDANVQLQAEVSNLADNSKQLNENIEQLKTENASLKTENDQMKADIEKLHKQDVMHIYYIIASIVISAVIASTFSIN